MLKYRMIDDHEVWFRFKKQKINIPIYVEAFRVIEIGPKDKYSYQVKLETGQWVDIVNAHKVKIDDHVRYDITKDTYELFDISIIDANIFKKVNLLPARLVRNSIHVLPREK